MLAKTNEMFRVDVETLQDVRQVVRDVAFFVFSENTSTPVNKLQVVGVNAAVNPLIFAAEYLPIKKQLICQYFIISR